jgi:integrase
VEDVPRHPRLQKRGSRYFLRVRVPTDLRSAIGKREIRKALGTSDPREALRRVRRASVEADAIFETCRAKAGPAASDRVPASEADLERLVLQAFQASERQNLTTFLKTPEEDYGEILSGLRDDESVYRGGLSPVVLPCLQKKADELLAANGLTLDPSSNTYTRFLWLLIRADLENIQRARERYSGNPTEPVFDRMFATSGAETSAPLSSSGGLTLRELIERYEKDPARRGLTEKTRHAYGTVFRALRELLGENKRARDITREDCRRVQEILCSLPPNASKRLPGLTLEEAAAAAKERGWPPLHHKTATNYLNNLSALFNWAVEEGHVEKNPARALKVAAPPGSAKSRLPFSTDQLTRIFNAPLYISAEGGSERCTGRFWVPLLSLWTGMRLNECVQLRSDDVAVLDGVDVILIRADEEGDKRLKTDASERFVPIHSELKKIGFPTYVRHKKLAGNLRLFPDLPKASEGTTAIPSRNGSVAFSPVSGPKQLAKNI